MRLHDKPKTVCLCDVIGGFLRQKGMVTLVSAYFLGGVVRVLAKLFVHAVQADSICDFPCNETGFIQDGEDAFMRLLHQIHYDLIVKVFDLKERKKGPV